ncbi:MAG: InlB B-repeat-containing protein [Oscillospiraceae bacterium]|nr:InlB B-repeat-containing protein [Oscillospiraceae bacterium]
MKHTSKKWLGLLLALVLLCSLLPVSALAEEPGETPAQPQEEPGETGELWVGGVKVTGETTSGEGWSYDAASKTLTLTDAKITATSTNTHSGGMTFTYVVYARGIDLTVSLSGVNTLGDGSADYTIMSDEGALTIKGGGSLTAAAGSHSAIYASNSISITGSTVTATSTGLDAIFADTSVTITDSTVTATGSRYGIAAVLNSITISGNSAVTASGGSVALRTTNGSVILNDGLEYIEGSADAKKAVIGPKPSYTVTVSAEPEGAGTASADPSSGAAGTEITLTATPNDGYSFLEWKVVTGNVSVENDKFTLGTENVELRAVFEPITYTVKFDPNGGDGQMDDAIVNYGDKLILPDCSFTPPAGMEFDKWDKGAPGDEIEVDGDMTVTAQWKEPEPPAAYTVKFDPNGGGGQMDDASVNVGDKLTLPECGFTPPVGKVFDKWDKGAPGEEIEVDGDMTVTAQWKSAVYTVTFDSKGGSEVPEQFVEYGGKATEPDEPTRSGFNFDTWYSDSACTQIFDFNTPITGDITLYAKWAQKVKYTVVSGGGKVYGKASGEELVITVKRNPKDNECFKHFSNVQIDGKTLTKDTDYTAEAGSTVITLKPEYLSKLNTGRHIITINFDDGKATTGMTVKAGSGGGGGRRGGGDNPDTGDLSNPGLWTGVLLLSGLALGGVIVTGRKARRAER